MSFEPVLGRLLASGVDAGDEAELLTDVTNHSSVFDSERPAGKVKLQDSVLAAGWVVSSLIAAGVRDAVLCPGSRSAPLAYALQLAEERGLLRLHVRHDERTAGFLALGCGRAAPDRPAVVVTTSGTAVANLAPAAMEARHAGVPLVLLTADRPRRLRGTWANQTSDLQSGLFTGVALRCWDEEPAALTGPAVESLVGEVLATTRGVGPGSGGPVHLNLCFEEPLQPEPGRRAVLPEVDNGIVGRFTSGPTVGGGLTRLTLRARTVVIAGDGAGPAARELAEAAGWPLLAEPSSGSRGGPNLIPGYRLLLADNDFAGQIERVVVLGRPTLSRPVTRLLDDPRVELVHVVRHPGESGPGRSVTRVFGRVAVGGGDEDAQWLSQWRRAGRRVARHIESTLSGWPRLTGPAVAAQVVAATRDREALVLGASNPIRDVDLAGGAVPDQTPVFANRGVAGIDGTLSTALGVAVASGRPTRLLVGDLTFLHDLAGLAVPGVELGDVRLQIVVLNDDGGGIFATLEHGQHQREFERIFGTPVTSDLARLSTGFGVRHRRVQTIPALRRALADFGPGLSVVEAPASRDDLRSLHQRLADFTV